MSEQIYVRVLQCDNGNFSVDPTDTLRINFTRNPGGASSEYLFPAKDKYKVNHTFTLSHKDFSQELMMTLRKKKFLQGDPVIGKYKINMSKVPLNEVMTTTFHMIGSKLTGDHGALIRLQIHRCTNGARPFDAPSSTIQL